MPDVIDNLCVSFMGRTIYGFIIGKKKAGKQHLF